MRGGGLEGLEGWVGEETGVPRENPWRRPSENVTYQSPKIQASSETRTRTIALVTGRKADVLSVTPRVALGPITPGA